jgi:hypothetical protein
LTDELLQNGVITTGEDSLVILPAIHVYQESNHRVRITVMPSPTGVQVPENESEHFQTIRIVPNPSGEDATLIIQSTIEVNCSLHVIHNAQVIGSKNISLLQGENNISLEPFSEVPTGLYFVQIRTKDSTDVVKWIKTDN